MYTEQRLGFLNRQNEDLPGYSKGHKIQADWVERKTSEIINSKSPKKGNKATRKRVDSQ